VTGPGSPLSCLRRLADCSRRPPHPIVNPNQPKVILISVGGSKEPILYSLRQRMLADPPEQIWFFCSEQSRPFAVEALHEIGLEFPERAVGGEYIVENQFEVLNACYRTLRQQIPLLLHKYSIAREAVLVDYTGGSKPMSAALVLAATEFFQNFAYVGGVRDKDGVGRTLPGQEQLVEQTTNPWAVLAVRELGRIADLWKGLQFEAAASLLRTTAGQVPKINKVRFQTFAKVADAMAARHRLDLREARALLESVHDTQKEVTPMGALFDGREDFELLSQLEAIQGVMRKCLENGGANTTLLRELLDNALRTASQGRYEDAAARLYRALEMQGQLWLKETSRGFFESGRCKGRSFVHYVPRARSRAVGKNGQGRPHQPWPGTALPLPLRPQGRSCPADCRGHGYEGKPDSLGHENTQRGNPGAWSGFCGTGRV